MSTAFRVRSMFFVYISTLIAFSTLFIPLSASATSHGEEFTATIENIGDTSITIKQDRSETLISIPQTIDIAGISDLNEGDRVTVAKILTDGGGEQYLITGFVRHTSMWLLIGFFALAIFLIYGKKGIKSLLNLLILLLSILFIMVPLILHGWSPVLVTTIVGTIALSVSVYVSHGINNKSHATIVGILSSLFLIGMLSSIGIMIASLTGFASEEASILLGLGYESLDMRSMLLAAMIIGALGVLDDVIIAQVSAVRELQQANTTLTKKELFDAAMRIGKDHTGAVINTLALAYTGAAFPLIILLYLQEPPFTSITSTLNNEIVATELVRLLSGTIGIVLSIPIATWLAVRMLYKKS